MAMVKKNKHLDFEMNLIPFIDLLSTCICFLLLTAVWVNVGAMNVKQAVGGQPASETAKKPTMWVSMSPDGDLTLDVRDARVPAKLAKFKIAGLRGKPNLEGLGSAVNQLKASEPALNTALIQPQGASVYEDIIDLMDQFKKSGVKDLGVAPL
jgi:biopolymer transport protein ExbD